MCDSRLNEKALSRPSDQIRKPNSDARPNRTTVLPRPFAETLQVLTDVSQFVHVAELRGVDSVVTGGQLV